MSKQCNLWYLLGCFIIGGCTAESQPSAQFPSSGWRYALDAVAVIASEAGNVRCTGTFLPDGRVVTAAHCIRRENSVASRSGWHRNPQQLWNYECEHHDDIQDIAVLAPIGSYPMRHGAMVVTPYDPHIGDSVATIGHPAGLTYSGTAGVVSYGKRVDARGMWTQVDFGVWYGNSGGPLIDRNGYLAGVASYFVATPHLGFFVHRDAVARALEAPMDCGL